MEKYPKCPNCGERAKLAGILQQTDGKVLCIYYCEKCGEDFEEIGFTI